MHLKSCLQIWFILLVNRLSCWFARKALTYLLTELIRFLFIYLLRNSCTWLQG